ncbi:MAG: IS1096 element passenger TnpR family protein [Bacteroidales bacterium]
MNIEILSEQTFYDLHDLIQDELEYDRSYLASFFTVTHSWKRIKEIPLIDMGNDSKNEVITMENAKLADFVKDAHQKFLYIFDYINDRGFKIELEEIKPESPNMYYPVCTDFGGEIPPQIGKKNTKKSSIFDDDDEDFHSPRVAKPLPILEDEFDDVSDIPLDKDIDEPFDLDLKEDEIEEDLSSEEYNNDMDEDKEYDDTDIDDDEEDL